MSIGSDYQKATIAQSSINLLKSMFGEKNPKGNSKFATKTTKKQYQSIKKHVW